MKTIRYFALMFLFVLCIAICVQAQSTLTPNVGFQLPAYQQQNWQVPIDYNFNVLDTILGGYLTLPTGTATPAITQASNWITANTTATTITNFIGSPFSGQTIRIICGTGDTHTSIANSATISLVSSPWSCSSSTAISLVNVNGVWTEISRSSAGGGGGGGNPSGNVGDLQTKATGTTFGASHLNDTGSQLNASENFSVSGPRPYIDVTNAAYGAVGDGGAESTTGSITNGTNSLVVANATGFADGMGVHVDGAGASGDVFLAKITAISGTTLTLSTNASTTVTNAVVGDDDTLAIQEAIAAYCASPASGGGSVFFPPGRYIFSQNQSVNASAYPFTVGCQGMHFLGGAGKEATGTQRPPVITLSAHCGPSPNAKAAFLFGYPNQNGTFENLDIQGCNQAIESPGQWLRLENDILEVSATGLAKNSPLWLYDTFNIFIDNSSFISNSTTAIPDILMTSETCGGCYQGVGNVYINNSFFDGGSNAILFTADANGSGADPGNWHIRNSIWESGNGGFLAVTNPSVYTIAAANEIEFDAIQVDDNMETNPPLLYVDLPNVAGNVQSVSGVEIVNSSSGFNAIQVAAGSVDSVWIHGCSNNGGCAGGAIDTTTGYSVGSTIQNTKQGLWITGDSTDVSGTYAGTVTLPPYQLGNVRPYGPAIAVAKSENQFASGGFDAYQGLTFGTGVQNGWNASLSQRTAPNIDVSFAANYPPTAVSATPSTTGGTLAAGTYYIWMVSATNTSCNTNTGQFSGGSLIAGPYTITGSTGSLAVTWTPSIAGMTTIQGYCVLANNVKQYNNNAMSSAFISGGSTASATVTSFPDAPYFAPWPGPSMVQLDHLTPSGAIFNAIQQTGAAGSGVACAQYDASGNLAPVSPRAACGSGGGSGTVTSVGLTQTGAVFTISGSPITTSGSINLAFANESAYTIFGNDTASSAAPTFFAPVLASSLFANQGSTTTVLHGNASGAPSWGAVNLATDVSGQLPISAVGSAGLSGTSPISISAAGAISCSTCLTSQVYPGAGIPVSTGSAWGTSLSETDGDMIAGVSGAWAKVTALPNGITATTQTTGDNTTKVATDAFVLANAITNPMTTLGDLIYGGASGAATRIAGATAPDGVPQMLSSTPNSSGVAQAPAWTMGGVAIDSQSTTYTIQCNTSGSPNDRLGLVVFTGSSATTFTLPQAVSSATSCFGANFATSVKNDGTAQLTITATTSVFEPQANASIILSPGQSVVIHSDNTNYYSDWTGQAGFQALTYNASGTTTFPAGFSPVANATVTATHSTSTTFSPTNLVNGGYYTVQISQDATGGGVTFTLGTGGSCSAWKVGGGGAGAITLSTAANAIDVLTWYYNGTNCVANFNKLFN